MACISTDVAVPRESATLILLLSITPALTQKTIVFLAILLRLLPASTLALALALLVPSFGLSATLLAGPATATALLVLVSPHEHRVVLLSNWLSLMQCCR